MSTIAALLANARRHAGLTQRRLSAAADIPQASVSLIERGLISPRAGTVERWLEACGVDLRLEVRPVPVRGHVTRRASARPPARREQAKRPPDVKRQDLDWASWMS